MKNCPDKLCIATPHTISKKKLISNAISKNIAASINNCGIWVERNALQV